MQDAFEQRIPLLGETREVVVIQGGRLVYERYAKVATPARQRLELQLLRLCPHRGRTHPGGRAAPGVTAGSS
jgi:hypothetical protein